MALWDDLQPATFEGVEFPLASKRMSGGRAIRRNRYPYRAGQAIEDTGREPYSFELEIPLFAGMDPALYPNRYEELLLVFNDTRTTGEGEYVDPELGPINAKVVSWDWAEDAMRRDGGILTVRLEEVSFDAQVFSVDTRDPQATAEREAEALDDELEGLGADEAELEESFKKAGVGLDPDELDKGSGELWTTQVTRFVERIEDGVQSVEDVVARVENIRSRVAIFNAHPLMQLPEATPANHAAARLAAAIVDLGAALLAQTAPVVAHTVMETMSVYELSSLLYGTPDRADEIMQRNPSPDPLFIRPGTVLDVLAS